MAARCGSLADATTIVAAGLLNQHRLWFALGITLLVAAKPGGLPYAAVALAAAFACGERRLLLPGALALGLAGARVGPAAVQRKSSVRARAGQSIRMKSSFPVRRAVELATVASAVTPGGAQNGANLR